MRALGWWALNVAAGVFAMLACGALSLAQPPAAIVTVAQVVEREVAQGQTFVGTVLPARRSVIGSAVDGRVEAFPHEDGDFVKKGEVLAQLRKRTLELEHTATQAEMRAAEAEHQELQNGTRKEDIDQARARRGAAESLMKYTEAKRRRIETLFERKSVSEDELQEAVSAYEVSHLKFAEAGAALEMAIAGPRPEQKARAKAKVEALAEHCARLQDQIDRHTIIAPFDGYVVKEFTEVGAWLKRGDPVAEVVELDKVDVEIMVLENHAPRLAPGVSARVELPALPQEALVGVVFQIIPQADVRSRSFPVKIRLENRLVKDQPLIKAGMFARVTLPLGQAAKTVLVPKDAVVLGGKTPVVWTVATGKTPAPAGAPPAGEGPRAVPVPVELGVAEGDWIEVRGALAAGQTVVMHGNERLFAPNQPIEIVKAPK
jgi:RND family efflux transporter MFP subunit